MRTHKLLSSLALFFPLLPFASSAAELHVPLAGEWRFRLDPKDTGIGDRWESVDLPDRIPLPGSTDEHRRGVKNDQVEPRRLTRAWEYVGPAWYQRDIEIPADWEGKRILVFLERCHWESQLWLDDVAVVDDPTRNHKLGAVFEARAGKGKLLVTTFDLETALDSRLAARQLRHSLLRYAASEKFDPQPALDLEFLDKLFTAKSSGTHR